jgi:hypothetical protein
MDSINRPADDQWTTWVPLAPELARALHKGVTFQGPVWVWISDADGTLVIREMREDEVS